MSIYGSYGFGKTAVACKVMTQLENDYAHVHGIIYLNACNGLGIDLEQIYSTSARMLGGMSKQKLDTVWERPKFTIVAKIQILLEEYRDNRCVILLDEMEHLLDAEGRIVDHDLRLFVETFLRQKHSARLLITSTEPLNLPDDVRRYEFALQLGKLPIEEAIAFFQDEDQGGRRGLALAEEDPTLVRTMVEKTYGNPKALQLVAGILANDDFMTLETLLQDTEIFQQEVIAKLAHEAQIRLDPDALRVMQALAVYGSDINEAAVRFLLEPYVRGLDVSAVIRQLARRKYITVKNRKTGEMIIDQLHKDASYRQIPINNVNTYNLKALESRAADYYAQLRIPT